MFICYKNKRYAVFLHKIRFPKNILFSDRTFTAFNVNFIFIRYKLV
ncbi:hypothetical protein SC1083_1951 [Aggregatibacter actinomycetemcomitans serotype e str. SC1083]|uniref:Uncharacterized protein n=1 Tax=Aggregatibacter actinomycetemcomitans serotype e str. SC1083 TaxID=907488 RepID=G4AAS5_AGGAC|nr:hypothetical protein SC1083_1951 [Aggregatibacter actinomycetemcomitans serotype e str. SC1083]